MQIMDQEQTLYCTKANADQFYNQSYLYQANTVILWLCLNIISLFEAAKGRKEDNISNFFLILLKPDLTKTDSLFVFT